DGIRDPLVTGVQTCALPIWISWLGFFYGGNTAGAVAGSLVAGFYLLRVHDLHYAIWCAVGLNVLVAVIALGLSAVSPYASKDAKIGRASCREGERVSGVTGA